MTCIQNLDHFGGGAAALAGDLGRSQLAQRIEHDVVVRLRRDLGEDPGDLAVGVDDEGGALHAPVGAPVVAFLDPGAVGLGDLVIGVCEQGEIEPVLEREPAPGLQGPVPSKRCRHEARSSLTEAHSTGSVLGKRALVHFALAFLEPKTGRDRQICRSAFAIRRAYRSSTSSPRVSALG